MVESVGLTDCDPLACTAPMPSIETSVAFEVCQLSVADCPAWIVSGLTEIEAVGDGGGGGGGGGGGAAFFLHAPNIRTAHNAITVASVFTACCRFMLFTLFLILLIPPENSKAASNSDEVICIPNFYPYLFLFLNLRLQSYFQVQFGCELRPVKVN